jgi:hypothetical protein
MSQLIQHESISTRQLKSFMKLGSPEEQALKLLILGGDYNHAIAYAEGIRPKDIQHLFYKSTKRLDTVGKNVFNEALSKNPKLLKVLIAKLILKKDYISKEDASKLLMSLDVEFA